MIGCLGDIAFTVSSSVVRTLDNFQWSGSARYAAHQRHLGRGLLEFTGMDPDKITFDIQLLVEHGVNPLEEVVKLWLQSTLGIFNTQICDKVSVRHALICEACMACWLIEPGLHLTKLCLRKGLQGRLREYSSTL